jgi:thioredoxin-dependent peroxiredoxin
MFQAAGVEIVGVSADSQETQDRFAQSLDLKFPLVGDPDGTIRGAYKVKWPLLGLARRTTYVIGRDRRIRQAFRSELDPDAHVKEACQSVAGRKPPAPPGS